MLTHTLISEARKFIRVPSRRVYGDLLYFLQSELGAVNVEGERESLFIRAKKKVIGAIGITVNIRVLPQGEASEIELNFGYRSFFVTVFASLIVMIVLCVLFLSAVPLFGIVPLILLMYNLGSNASSFISSMNKFLLLLENSYAQEQLKEIKKRWQMDLKSANDLYERLLNAHIKVWGDDHVLEYKISEYMKEGLTREEAIRKIAEEEGVS